MQLYGPQRDFRNFQARNKMRLRLLQLCRSHMVCCAFKQPHRPQRSLNQQNISLNTQQPQVERSREMLVPQQTVKPLKVLGHLFSETWSNQITKKIWKQNYKSIHPKTVEINFDIITCLNGSTKFTPAVRASVSKNICVWMWSQSDFASLILIWRWGFEVSGFN